MRRYKFSDHPPRIFGDKLWLNYGAAYRREEVRPGVVPPGLSAFTDTSWRTPSTSYSESPVVTWCGIGGARGVQFPVLPSPPVQRRLLLPGAAQQEAEPAQFSDMEGMRNRGPPPALRRKTVDDFSFVGIADRLPSPLRALWPDIRFANLESVPVPRENVNPARPARRYRLDPGDYRYILDRNAPTCLFSTGHAAPDALADPRSRRPTWQGLSPGLLKASFRVVLGPEEAPALAVVEQGRHEGP